MVLSLYAMRTPANHPLNRSGRAGFTILELSVVLVIIGLITASILGGQNLIDAAKIRAQIGQIDQFNTAVGMFQVKYGSLPGDINATDAATYGFVSRPGAGEVGLGDGNGIIEASTAGWTNGHDAAWLCGETAMFWNDLGTAKLRARQKIIVTVWLRIGWVFRLQRALTGTLIFCRALIPGSYVGTAQVVTSNNCQTAADADALATLIPRAKMGVQAFITVLHDSADNNHYFQLITGYGMLATGVFANPAGTVGYDGAVLTPIEAYNIDQKIDDGLPLAGSVTARQTDTLDSVRPENIHFAFDASQELVESRGNDSVRSDDL
jgi:prepilin-type N-terminal cleavage/methylation domain-containing protein